MPRKKNPKRVAGGKRRHKTKGLPLKFRESQIVPGEVRSPGAPKGKRLLTCIKELLQQHVPQDKEGKTRMDAAAEAFVTAMVGGSFAHLQEFMNREEGRVGGTPADAVPVKLYVEMPIEGKEAP